MMRDFSHARKTCIVSHIEGREACWRIDSHPLSSHKSRTLGQSKIACCEFQFHRNPKGIDFVNQMPVMEQATNRKRGRAHTLKKVTNFRTILQSPNINPWLVKKIQITTLSKHINVYTEQHAFFVNSQVSSSRKGKVLEGQQECIECIGCPPAKHHCHQKGLLHNFSFFFKKYFLFLSPS